MCTTVISNTEFIRLNIVKLFKVKSIFTVIFYKKRVNSFSLNILIWLNFFPFQTSTNLTKCFNILCIKFFTFHLSLPRQCTSPPGV